MRGEGVKLRLPVRVRAFLGATLIVAVLWLATVVSVKVFVPSLGGPGPRLDSAGRFVIRRNGKLHFITLHENFGSAVGFAAWHKVVLVMILVTLAALVVAGVDWLRRASRRSRRAGRDVSDVTP
jgi:hypothetical protein